MIKQCGCGRLVGPDRADCPECADPSFEWIKASGDGHLVSWIVTHNRSPEGGTDTEVVGLVELAEGPWLYAVIQGTDGVALQEGVQLHLDVLHPEEGEPIPAFCPR